MHIASKSRALLAALAVALTLPACGGSTPGARIERGETITTGNDTYDTFFREVLEVKSEADKAATELTDAARPLKDAIGAQNKSAPVDVVRAEAKKLQMSGTLLHLDLLPETKVVIAGKPDEPTEKLLTASEQAAKGALAIARRSGELLVRIADLERRHEGLVTSARSDFPDEGKRAQITRELKAAGDLLADARTAGAKHGGAASKLAVDLAIALETGAGSGAVAKKPTGKPGGGGKPGGTGVSGPAKPRREDFDR